MKQSLFILFLILFLRGEAQVVVNIAPSDTILCYRDSIGYTAMIDTVGTGTIQYQWQKNEINISGASDSLFGISHITQTDTARYRCIVTLVTLLGTYTDTSNIARVRMHPKISIDTLYRYNPLGCFGVCKGQYKVLVSEGTPFSLYPPYIYEWHAGHSQDTIVFGLCPRPLPYKLTITDSLGCSIDTSYFVDYLKSPKVTFDITPKDTVYLTNPNVTVAFPDSMRQYIANWTWDFGNGTKIPNQNPAYHTFENTGEFPIQLTFTDLNGCDTTIIHDLTVKVAELKIPNVFTPNGDGMNDRFMIEINGEGKEVDYRIAYLSTELLVYDRWGRKVYSQSNYQSGDWDGARLSGGTYFYILKCHGQFGDDVFRGSLTIIRGSGGE